MSRLVCCDVDVLGKQPLLAQHGVLGKRSLPFLASGLFSFCCLLWSTEMVPETLPVEKRRPFRWGRVRHRFFI